MCCFSRPVKHVSATHIFARPLGGGRQALVYSMNVAIDEALAMVLPIPVTDGCGDDAVGFVDLSGYAELFRDMGRAFPERVTYSKGSSRLAPASLQRPRLAVHEVGAFVASFVPSRRDFDRLDERFRLTPEVFESRAEYADYGFCVFQLSPRKGWFGRFKPQTVHPMAFTFPSRRPRALFFPTLHVHDGHVPDRASFDHSLYCQTDDELLSGTFGFERSPRPLGEHVDARRAAGLVDDRAIAFRCVLQHELRNADAWYEPPECAGAHVLRGEGERYAFHLSATAAYYTELTDPKSRRRHEVARTKLDALHAALDAGLRDLTSRRASELHLVPLGPELQRASADGESSVYFWDNDGIHRLESGAATRVQLTFSTTVEGLEPQRVELAFERVPSQEAIREIHRAIDAMVTRAIA
jgi:hypothetical protein